MMWRERIAAARERGRFDGNDYQAWGNPDTCLVGEALQGGVQWIELNAALDIRVLVEAERRFWPGVGAPFQCLTVAALNTGFDAIERYLEMAEDEALRLKRETGERQ